MASGTGPLSAPFEKPVSALAIEAHAKRAMRYGLAGLFCCVFLAPFAIVEGRKALSLIQETGAGKEHESMARNAILAGYGGVAIWLGAAVFRFVILPSR